VVAFNDVYKGIRTYALDRIESVEKEPNIKFNDSLNKNHLEQFKDIIGVTIYSEKKPIEIIATISKIQKPYVKTKKLHRSQTILKEDENGMVISLKIIPNYEFYSTILSAGDGIEIISPAEIRKEVADRLRRAFNQYKKE
jgi:predicted DNA-binding transcriptional regulator YafY